MLCITITVAVWRFLLIPGYFCVQGTGGSCVPTFFHSDPTKSDELMNTVYPGHKKICKKRQHVLEYGSAVQSNLTLLLHKTIN